MFLVIKQGVYRHDILDARLTRSEALSRAEELLRAENDDYHDMGVVEVMKGKGEVGGCSVQWERGKFPYAVTPERKVLVSEWEEYT